MQRDAGELFAGVYLYMPDNLCYTDQAYIILKTTLGDEAYEF